MIMLVVFMLPSLNLYLDATIPMQPSFPLESNSRTLCSVIQTSLFT